MGSLQEIVTRKSALQLLGLVFGSVVLNAYAPKQFIDPMLVPQKLSETRDISRRAILMGGGTSEDDIDAFYVDLMLWYQMMVEIFQIPKDKVEVYHLNGVHPNDAYEIISHTEIFDNFQPQNIPIAGDTQKDTLLDALHTAARQSDEQLFIFRSGHGILDYTPERGLRSVMILSQNEVLDSMEFADVLRNNTAGIIVSFLNQCYPITFLEQSVATVPNMAVFTPDRNSLSWIRPSQSEFPWSKAVRETFYQPMNSDMNGDGSVSLVDAQSYILETDTMHTEGYHTESYGQIRSQPSLAVGDSVNPNEVLLQY